MLRDGRVGRLRKHLRVRCPGVVLCGRRGGGWVELSQNSTLQFVGISTAVGYSSNSARRSVLLVLAQYSSSLSPTRATLPSAK